MSPRLPDYLRSDLDIVFVGINPGLRSAAMGHHYAGRGNFFWPLLHEAGFVPEPLTYVDDWRAPEFGIGLTNLVDRPSRGIDDLSPAEMREGARRLREKLVRYKPRVICFNGKRIYEVLSGRGCAMGLQRERLGDSLIYVMPSTSARTASYQRDDKLRFFLELKRVVDASRERPLGPSLTAPADAGENALVITNVKTVAVYVSDQEAAVRFYTEELGFEVRRSEPMGPQGSWIEVAPPGAQTRLVIYPRALRKDWTERRPSVVFGCRDTKATYRELAGPGVNFTQTPTKMPWGIFAGFVDPDGNEFVLTDGT